MLISSEGQPVTCYWCNAPGHQFQECPDRKRPRPSTTATAHKTWADVVTERPDLQRDTEEPRQMDVDKETLVETGCDVRDLTPSEISRTRSRRGLTTPKELWSSLLEDDNPCEKAVHASKGNTNADMIDTQDICHKGQGEGRDADIISTSLSVEDIFKHTTDTHDVQKLNTPPQDDDTTCMSDDNHSQPTHTPPASIQQSPKRSKKLKTERGDPTPQDRTRIKTRSKTPQTLQIGTSTLSTQLQNALHVHISNRQYQRDSPMYDYGCLTISSATKT